LASLRAAATVLRVPTPHSALPLTVNFRDPSSPIGVDAIVTAWQLDDTGPGHPASMTVTIGGTLHDLDKGPVPLADLRLRLLVVGGRFEPLAVIDGGGLSDFQQDGLLDAITSALNALDPPLHQRVSE
jgi:hypothetical protein